MKAQSINVGIVGVTGYTGLELLRILANHPAMQVTCVTSRADAGKTVQEIYPFFQGFPFAKLVIETPDTTSIAKQCNLAFLAVPHGTAMEMADELLGKGCKVVDLSADFRIDSKETYEQWYNVPHTKSHRFAEAVYGIPEINADAIAQSALVANPGCYPTSVILGLLAPLRLKLIKPASIIIDSKSGATGAGRKATIGSLFCEVTDSFKAYNIGRHRHTPEIEQELSKIANTDITVSFTPHLLPIQRGILSTIYTELTEKTDTKTVIERMKEFWKGHPFIRVLPAGTLPEVRFVRGTMFCDLGFVADPRTNRLIVVSAIDNICRGASGQAIANANLLYNLPVATGLNFAPLLP